MTTDTMNMWVNRYHQEGGGRVGSSIETDYDQAPASSFMDSSSREGVTSTPALGGCPVINTHISRICSFPLKRGFSYETQERLTCPDAYRPGRLG